MENFYMFEVIEDFKYPFVANEKVNNIFKKGERFIGWEFKLDNTYAMKSNLKEYISIPIEKVKKVYKIEFKEIEGE